MSISLGIVQMTKEILLHTESKMFPIWYKTFRAPFAKYVLSYKDTGSVCIDPGSPSDTETMNMNSDLLRDCRMQISETACQLRTHTYL